VLTALPSGASLIIDVGAVIAGGVAPATGLGRGVTGSEGSMVKREEQRTEVFPS
jgi:hypothetical protein